jgi:hypothetical protein
MDGGVATVGAASVIEILAEPVTVPLVAATVAEPAAYEAVYSPEAFTDPAPVLLHVKLG